MENLITEKTILIVKEGNNSYLYESNNKRFLHKKIYDVINEGCNYYGSSYKGRVEGSNYLLGSIYKAPIIISETKNIIMFPTTSFACDDCMWINYAWIDKYYYDNNKSVILFKNGLKIDINLSSKIINNQILRSSRLESILKSKKR